MAVSAEQAPDYIGEVVGWRAWAAGWKEFPYSEGEPGDWRPEVLRSLNQTVWPRGWLEATCMGPRDHDDTPSPICSCGIYALSSVAQVEQLRVPDWVGVPVVGQVSLAGTVIPGERGYRAERARPLRLFIPRVCDELAKPLSQRYGVPVHLVNPYRFREELNGYRT